MQSVKSSNPTTDVPPYHTLYDFIGETEKADNLIEDGRIEVQLDSRLSRALSKFIPPAPDGADEPSQSFTPPLNYEARDFQTTKLNIVIQVVGSRGDVQPFVAIGNELQKHGHRVRIATHDVFEKFVRDHGLEFYPIGGDPAELMAYMVKNPNLIPSMSSLRAGDVGAKRKMIMSMLEGCWKSCIGADLKTNVPFTADAIIGNPPSFAHVHCAQALGCPVHIMFTMPWSCTRAFPHPLANLRVGKSGADVNSSNANYLSYLIVDWMTWQGLGDIVNSWRATIGLAPLNVTEGPLLAQALRVPHTYCWSPALVPRPTDWPSHIDVCGFFFRNPPSYSPEPDLKLFLDSGPPPVYIGFGSIVIDHPDQVTAIILEAIQTTGVRALVSKGWSKLGAGLQNNNKVFFLDDCPHEWLFQHVAAVVHHGGAGTTACGLLHGRPTTIIPFFGDQPFWGKMVAKAGAGPAPISFKALTAHNLADAISFCLKDEPLNAAMEIARKMRTESGVQVAVESFHRGLREYQMQCDVLQGQPASWIYRKGRKRIRLSRVAAQILADHLKLDTKRLRYYEPAPIVIEPKRWDPVSGSAVEVIGLHLNVLTDAAGVVTKPMSDYKDWKVQKQQNLTNNPDESGRPSVQLKSSSESIQDLTRGQSSSKPAAKTNGQIAAKMAASSAKSLGNVVGRPWRSIFVDVPLALTDGLNSVPGLYGSKVREREPISDFKSGATVAGKSFVLGIAGGLSDIVLEPYNGGKEEGALGVFKGIGKGSLGFLAKTGSAGLGLIAYTGQGISKSLYTSYHAKTRLLVIERRTEEGRYFYQNAAPGQYNHETIIMKFENLVKGIEDSTFQ